MSKRINLFLFLALTSLLAGSGNCYARSHTIVHEGLDLESPLHKVGPDIKALDKMIFTITTGVLHTFIKNLHLKLLPTLMKRLGLTHAMPWLIILEAGQR